MAKASERFCSGGSLDANDDDLLLPNLEEVVRERD